MARMWIRDRGKQKSMSESFCAGQFSQRDVVQLQHQVTTLYPIHDPYG